MLSTIIRCGSAFPNPDRSVLEAARSNGPFRLWRVRRLRQWWPPYFERRVIIARNEDFRRSHKAVFDSARGLLSGQLSW
jgi:hypothetical protein